jgi:hypothetical protein
MAQILAKARNGIHHEVTVKSGFIVCLQISASSRKHKNTPSEGKGHTVESYRARQFPYLVERGRRRAAK